MIEEYEKASSYPILGSMANLYMFNTDQPSKVVATMSFSKDVGAKCKLLKSLLILSIGEQSQFVDPSTHLVMAKQVSTEIRRKLGQSRCWGLYTCEVRGEGFIRLLESVIVQHWNTMENGPLQNIACHAVYVNGATEFEKQKSMEMDGEDCRKIKFTTLKRKRKDLLCHIDVYSHDPRNQALHDELEATNQRYKEEWEKVIQNRLSVTTFFKTHCKTLRLSNDQAVSFQYPTIQLGFSNSEESRGRQHAGNHMVYFRNNNDGTTHHRFPSQDFGSPKSPSSNDYLHFLKVKSASAKKSASHRNGWAV